MVFGASKTGTYGTAYNGYRKEPALTPSVPSPSVGRRPREVALRE
jgi:hypothetical protein